MSDVSVLSRERNQLFDDLLAGKVPKRVPILVTILLEFAIQYAGRELYEDQWKPSMLEEIFDKICQDFPSDVTPMSATRFPSYYQILGAKNWVMSSSGFMQHPEIEGMLREDYDYFISSPYDCIVEKILPRIYSNLNTDSSLKALTFAKAYNAFVDENNNKKTVYKKLKEKYGYADTNFFAGHTEAPFDFIADQLRGFKGISVDVRRVPDKVKGAVEAITPLLIKTGKPAASANHLAVFIPLHMACYLRPNDFKELYWPTLKILVEAMAEEGYPSYLFAQNDWTPYLDYLNELPENTIIRFEYGNPELIKKKLGDKHIITGLYPINILKTGTKQQCVDKAKELIDILAPGGRYFFNFDKNPITLDSVNVENLKAVLEYIVTETKY